MAHKIAFPLPTGDSDGNRIEHVDDFQTRPTGATAPPLRCCAADCHRAPVVVCVTHNGHGSLQWAACWPHAQGRYGEAVALHEEEHRAYERDIRAEARRRKKAFADVAAAAPPPPDFVII